MPASPGLCSRAVPGPWEGAGERGRALGWQRAGFARAEASTLRPAAELQRWMLSNTRGCDPGQHPPGGLCLQQLHGVSTEERCGVPGQHSELYHGHP